MDTLRPKPVHGQAALAIHSVDGGRAHARWDQVVIEEPLEIRVGFGPADKRDSVAVTVTMRTPGDEEELAAGFLFAEDVLQDPSETLSLKPAMGGKIIRVELKPSVLFDASRFRRNFASTASCGVCGQASLDALENRLPIVSTAFQVPAPVIDGLASKLRERQSTFEATGGLHAAAWFDVEGNLIELREDVGRHNAVDKLLGRLFLDGKLPLGPGVLFLSGRAGYELVQKAVVAGVSLIAAVGAPTSFAVEVAERCGATLVGFVRDGRFNIYSHPERIGVSP